MDLNPSQWLAKLAYGAFFAVFLPLGLWVWSSHLACGFPAVHSPWIGGLALLTGALLLIPAMWRLWHDGGGLPMNAFPPPRVVTAGVYRIVPHPVYLGFVLGCAGASVAGNSASGLWIVTPVAALGCTALVLGYEGPDLRRRFGAQLPAPWIGLLGGQGALPPLARVGTALAVLIPGAVLYWAVKGLGVPADASETRMNWEWKIPILPTALPFYASIYAAVPLTFLLCADRAMLRRLTLSVWLAVALNTLLYLTVPATAAFRSVPVTDGWSQWLAWEQRLAWPAAGSLPSFHVTWAVICAPFLAHGRSRPWRALSWCWCAGVAASCLLTGMHSVADLAAGAATGALCLRAEKLWRQMLECVEHLGNTWNERHLGPLRIINHSIWSGLAGFTVMLLAGMSAEAGNLGWLVLVALCSLFGAAVFAQRVEGSSALLRPFGYYGAILGGLLTLALMALTGGPAVDVTAALALAAPWAQAVGRVRCIVQGCCHGRPVDWGIRITNPHSRVVKLAGLAHTPIHPTPLYSILANLVIGVLLLRMRVLGAGPFSIAGLYLLLAGMCRFVEEAYRGEPQTRHLAGLPIYQWLAVGSVVMGMVLMSCHGSTLAPVHAPTAAILATALGWALVTAFAMSMDFPASRRRFARLTG